MAVVTPVLLSIQMPFYPIQSAYDKRRLYDMQNPAVMEAYVDALRREMEAAAPDYADCEVQAARIGGGIASHAADEPLGLLLRDMRGWFRFAEDAPVIFTVHPGMVSVETLTACRRGGVTELDVDYCTSDPFESELMGRFLPPEAMNTTMMVLGNAPLSLSFEIMTGLPGQSETSLLRTLNQVKAYGAKEIVLRPLEIIPGTKLAGQAAALAASSSPRRHLPNEKEREALWQSAQAWCVKEGYASVVSGRYALPGYGSRYHRLLAQGMSLLGFGVNAVTRMDGVEAVNTGDLNTYIRFSPDPEKLTTQVTSLS